MVISKTFIKYLVGGVILILLIIAIGVVLKRCDAKDDSGFIMAIEAKDQQIELLESQLTTERNRSQMLLDEIGKKDNALRQRLIKSNKDYEDIPVNVKRLTKDSLRIKVYQYE